MSELGYLADGLFEDGEPRTDLEGHAVAVAAVFAAAGVDPASVEILAELLARVAKELGDAVLDGAGILAAAGLVTPPAPVLELLQVASAPGLGARSLAALAVHLVDVAEAMAIRIYVAELPNLTARSDRSGDAARSVGLARHLRG
ncbi:MAG: hypothetical protein HY903_17310 [Deltaproteobacteria bacterium]|nr:hypothetical protein [Deltaproteobacteria bacterium]